MQIQMSHFHHLTLSSVHMIMYDTNSSFFIIHVFIGNFKVSLVTALLKASLASDEIIFV